MEAPSQGQFSLPKAERLSGRTAVASVFSKGKWGAAGVLRYCFLKGNGLGINRVMVSVPKRNFKRAVKRNLLRRRLRESWRRQKSLLPEGAGIDVALLYSSKELLDYQTIYDTVRVILRRLGNDE